MSDRTDPAAQDLPPEDTTPAGRPVTTTTAPTTEASPRNTPTTPGCARAAPGSATIGANVPSKSSATTASPGPARIALNPSRPAAVAGTYISSKSILTPLPPSPGTPTWTAALRPGRTPARPPPPDNDPDPRQRAARRPSRTRLNRFTSTGAKAKASSRSNNPFSTW